MHHVLAEKKLGQLKEINLILNIILLNYRPYNLANILYAVVLATPY